MEPTTTPKTTGIELITSTLNRGSFGDQVKALQQYLNGLGYDVGKVDSVFGPKVEAAVKQYQLDNNLKPDGVFGPKSVGMARTLGNTNTTAGAPGTGKLPDDPSNMFNAETGKINEKFQPKNQQELDQFYNLSVASHPVFSGNSADALAYAAETGDFNGLMNPEGKPFSNEVQSEVIKEAESALAPGFEAKKSFDTQNVESDLDQKKRDYEEYLLTQKENFEADKDTLDQNAADQGVLFSGGRIEREKRLGDSYARNEEVNRANMGSSIGDIARKFQYAEGNEAAQNPSISKYYSLGSNTYNPNTARNNVGAGSISNVYNPAGSNFQGTNVNSNKAAVNVRAANLLKNRGNKLLASGYGNQF